METPIYYSAPSWLVCLLLLAGMILCIALGLRVNKRKQQHLHSKDGDSLVLSTLFALMGLLLAFTFSAAASRFEKRREFIIEEANAIGTALLRCDLYPDTARQNLRQLFGQYIDLRIAFFNQGKTPQQSFQWHQRSAAKGLEIWQLAAQLSGNNANYLAAMQMTPALNNMLDIATTRGYNSANRVPDTIMYFLFLTLLITAFFIGFSSKDPNHFDWITSIGFCLVTALVCFTLLDLDQPKRGFITTETAHGAIMDLKQLFNDNQQP